MLAELPRPRSVPRRGALAFATLSSSLALAACGGDDSSESEAETPDAAAKSVMVAMVNGDTTAVCDGMTDELVETTESETGQDCVDSFSFTQENATQENVEIVENGTFTTKGQDDTTATVEGTTSEGTVNIDMELVDGQWKVNELTQAP